MQLRPKGTSKSQSDFATLGEYKETEIDYDSDLPTWRRDNSISGREFSLEATLSSKTPTPNDTSSWTFRESPSRLRGDLRTSTAAFRKEVSRLMESIQSVTHKVAKSRRQTSKQSVVKIQTPQLLFLYETIAQLNGRLRALEACQPPEQPKAKVNMPVSPMGSCGNCGASCAMF